MIVISTTPVVVIRAWLREEPEVEQAVSALEVTRKDIANLLECENVLKYYVEERS